MRYAIFADVHSNQEAFQEVISAYKKEGIDKYICVGDIVGYGADLHWCIEEVKKLDAKIVCGNHDWASVGLFDKEYFNPLAKEAVLWTEKELSEEEKKFLIALELVINEEGFSVVHGSLDMPDEFPYILDTESAYRCFIRMKQDICFVGHTHIPVVFFMEGKNIKYTFENSIEIKPDVKYIVNVGSVGQPRDRNPKATFSIFDTDKNTIEIKRVDYDIETAKNKILNAGLPARLGYRLLEGR